MGKPCWASTGSWVWIPNTNTKSQMWLHTLITLTLRGRNKRIAGTAIFSLAPTPVRDPASREWGEEWWNRTHQHSSSGLYIYMYVRMHTKFFFFKKSPRFFGIHIVLPLIKYEHKFACKWDLHTWLFYIKNASWAGLCRMQSFFTLPRVYILISS